MYPPVKSVPIQKVDVRAGESKFEAILRAVLNGELPPDQATSVMSLIESVARTQVAYALEEQRRAQLEVLKRAQEEGTVRGGVMVVPLLEMNEWQVLAAPTQQQLKAKVRE